MLFDQFDQIKIISLAHRKERRREMSAELHNVGIEIDESRVAFLTLAK